MFYILYDRLTDNASIDITEIKLNPTQIDANNVNRCQHVLKLGWPYCGPQKREYCLQDGGTGQIDTCKWSANVESIFWRFKNTPTDASFRSQKEKMSENKRIYGHPTINNSNGQGQWEKRVKILEMKLQQRKIKELAQESTRWHVRSLSKEHEEQLHTHSSHEIQDHLILISVSQENDPSKPRSHSKFTGGCPLVIWREPAWATCYTFACYISWLFRFGQLVCEIR